MNNLFIDVGVGKINSEAWTLTMLENFTVGEWTIIGLEPGLEKFKKLKDHYPGTLLNVAAADKEGVIDCWEDPNEGIVLFLGKDNEGKNFKLAKKSAIRLDDLAWKGFDRIAIWADIEGSELLMLKGSTEILSSKKVDWINLEVRKTASADGWCTALEVYNFLEKFGFKPSVPLEKLRENKHRDVLFTQ